MPSKGRLQKTLNSFSTLKVKLIYSQKATLLLTPSTLVKSKVEISQIFLAFSEDMNFFSNLRFILVYQYIFQALIGFVYRLSIKKYRKMINKRDQLAYFVKRLCDSHGKSNVPNLVTDSLRNVYGIQNSSIQCQIADANMLYDLFKIILQCKSE